MIYLVYGPCNFSTVLWLTGFRSETLALDLKAFAAHANRSTIRAEDVKLMARKTPELVSVQSSHKLVSC